MSKFKKAVEIKVHNAEALKVGIADEYKPLTIPVFVSALLTLGIRQELDAGKDPFEVIDMCRTAIKRALGSNSLSLMVEVGDENEKSSDD